MKYSSDYLIYICIDNVAMFIDNILYTRSMSNILLPTDMCFDNKVWLTSYGLSIIGNKLDLRRLYENLIL